MNARDLFECRYILELTAIELDLYLPHLVNQNFFRFICNG